MTIFQSYRGVNTMSDHDFSQEEKAKLEEDMKNKVLAHFCGQKDILDYLEFTLGNFSYRYLESPTTGELPVSWNVLEGSTAGSLEVVAYESNLAQSLKTKNEKTRKGIIEMAKTSKKADNPKVKYTLGVSWKDLRDDDVDILAYAQVSWDTPEHHEETEKRNRMEKRFHYSDAFDMRNNFPRELEDICDIF